ncbi:hypothetical protein ACFWSF_00090 [Streptomyces sp. NPDC058611]|uniref:hypothetical protein n=1 Tax=unclassified Streptomyces TaxID=2593676 RepID=UPI003663B680
MSAPTHTRPLPPRPRPTAPAVPPAGGARPAAAVTGRPRGGRARGDADARLHWWALVLPALAFGVLLLLAGSGEARAATADGDGPGLVRVAEQLLRAVG